MFQRKPNLKPAVLNDNSGHRIDVRTLIRFLKQAHGDLVKKGEEDSSFRFEMLIQYLEEDFDYKKGLEYRPMYVGL